MTASPLAGTSLQQAAVGATVVLDAFGGDARDVAMLRAMGLRPGASVRVCRRGEPTILEIACPCGGACRIGLTRALAARITIRCG